MILIDKKGHMVSTVNFEELHNFAAKIGLCRDWFQDTRIPHYDLTTERMKIRALKEGARLVDSREIVRRGLEMYES